MNDLSFDIETLATAQDAYILSIAAVPFDRVTGKIADGGFHTHIVGEQEGRRIDAGTVSWWMKQEHEARRRVFAPDNYWTLERALHDLAAWVKERDILRVWGNGSSFDIGILEHAFASYSIKIPWNYRGVRDMRTIVDLALEAGGDVAVDFRGVAHDAMDDARRQAAVIAKAYAVLIDLENFEPPTVGNEVV